jgi:haloalkane dehalogenase
MNNYRRPFAEPGEGRRPTLSWARQLPIDGEPADVTEIITAYGEWLSRSDIPKLYIQGDPGRLQPSQHAFCRTWPAQSEVVVRGLHNLQEDSPEEIGQAIASWLHHLIPNPTEE